jgi:hypothetical protein
MGQGLNPGQFSSVREAVKKRYEREAEESPVRSRCKETAS